MGEFADETALGSGGLDSAEAPAAESADESAADVPEGIDGRAVDSAEGELATQSTAPAAQAARVPEVGGVDPHQVLDTLRERPVSEHAEVYEELHTHLQRTLAEIDGG